MTVEQLLQTPSFRAAELPPLLLALWRAAQHDWEGAHELAQNVASRDGSWVHAYLHRREGDDWNAAYWYRQAGQLPFRGSLEDEWRKIAAELLSR